MRRLLFAAAILLSPAVAPAQGISGIYLVEGAALDGGTLGGEVEITETDGHLDVFWHEGDSTMPGAGIREGRVVTISWGYDETDPAVYVLMPNGELWRAWNADGVVERLRLVP